MSNGSGRDDAWQEVADGCFVRRYEPFDVSCGVVAGGAGLLVIDTRASLAQGRELAEAVRALSALPIRAVVNTHVHFDHTFGNAAFDGAPIVAHESLPVSLPATMEEIRADYTDDSDDPSGPPYRRVPREELLATEVVPPTETFSSVWAVDLGDRLVELVHPGRGHTDGDIVIRVPDTDVVYAGDLIESSAPPSYGTDCFPLEWPDSLDLVIGLLTTDSVVVPGHGPAVDREFVQRQRGEVVDVAEQIRVLATGGVRVDDALDRGTWPYSSDRLANAVRRGYATLA
jgi:glyoxylase-like metal-dependent hydrolase (beta-lactamase superfamily II)